MKRTSISKAKLVTLEHPKLYISRHLKKTGFDIKKLYWEATDYALGRIFYWQED